MMLSRSFNIARWVFVLWLLLGILGMMTGHVVVDHTWLEWLIFCPVLLWLLSLLVQWASRLFSPKH